MKKLLEEEGCAGIGGSRVIASSVVIVDMITSQKINYKAGQWGKSIHGKTKSLLVQRYYKWEVKKEPQTEVA